MLREKIERALNQLLVEIALEELLIIEREHSGQPTKEGDK
jgi:hypothetical protein